MAHLPVITGFGGINAAGRSSGHNGFRRLVFDKLSSDLRASTLQQLATLTGQLRHDQGLWRDANNAEVNAGEFLRANEELLLANSLIRKINDADFDPTQIPYHQRAVLGGADTAGLEFTLRKRDLPSPLPAGWQLKDLPEEDSSVHVTTNVPVPVMLHSARQAEVNTAAQLPGGFDPAASYASRNHPRALQMTVFGASDAINSLGIDWEQIRALVPADKISVYAGSCLGQLDSNGSGGMLQARLLGKKVTSKQLPLGLNEMPADFLNAYLLGSLGTTGHNNGACATFLYNLRQGMRDIQSGTHRIAIIGTSESSLIPEAFDAFTTMGALASDASLLKLDGLAEGESPDHRRACRPFGDNSGFTLAESAQFIVLFDDELALETGASIYGAVNDIFVHADGFKKSITGPGMGNYLTMAKALAATKNVIGEERLRHNTFVQAHGTGTPQNRVTESEILSKLAQTFGIASWPVAAVKSYVGHSIASAAGDQLITSLGAWAHHMLPGIKTTAQLADDVTTTNLDFLLAHKEFETESMDAALINSKGFGGNNASASILSPHTTRAMLSKRHGSAALRRYQARNESAQEQQQAYDDACGRGENRTIYKFDHGVLTDNDLTLDTGRIKIDNGSPDISLAVPNPYIDMCD
jgi:acetoacetyl-[acyl-carrier protein] synthase